MAIFLPKDEYVQMSMPKAMNRTNPAPLDASAVWTSLEELRNYAATNPVAYVGQILSLVAYNEETEAITEVKAYIIKDAAGNIEEVGSATLGDTKTIELEDGVLSLKNWGKEYYKWIDPVGEEGEENYVAGHHEKYVMAEGDTWPAGLEPKAATAADGTVVLAWYQPSTVTIQGVSSAIASVQNTVTELTAGIGSAEDAAGTETVYGAVNAVKEANEANAEAIEALQEEAAKHLALAGGAMTGDLVLADGHKAASENVVDTKIATAIGSAGHLKREIVDALPAVEDADPDVIYMIKSGLSLTGDKYAEYMLINGAFEQIGDTSVDLNPYAKKVENAVEGNLAGLDADGALTDSGVAAQDVADHMDDEDLHIAAGERDAWTAGAALAGENAAALAALVKISQDDADKLAALPAITSIGAGLTFENGVLDAVIPEEYQLPAATANTIGGVKVAGVADSGLILGADGALVVGVSANANGLKKLADGLALELANADHAGAMSAAMFNKLSAIAEGAEVNTIEGVLLDGIAATIENEQVLIPTATTALAGLVYSTDADNGVAVAEDGTMSVNRIDVAKLFVAEGDELILNGGKA